MDNEKQGPETAITILHKSKQAITDRDKAGEVINRVVTRMAEEVIKEREEILYKVLKKREEIRKSIDTIKPDQISFDETGKEVNKTFSKEKYEELSKSRRKLEDIDKAIEKATNIPPDYEWAKKFI